MKLAKNQAKAKQHLEAELLLFEIFSHSSSALFSKNNTIYSKNKQKKNKCVCIHEIIRLIIMKMKIKMKNRLHGCDINRHTLDKETNIIKWNVSLYDNT